MATELEDLEVLKAAEAVADGIWTDISKWDHFGKDTVGKQLVRAADSIGANIAEAYGRFHFGEKLKFLYYARGSLFETKFWLNRCRARELLEEQKANQYASALSEIARHRRHCAASFTAHKKNQTIIKESYAGYQVDAEVRSEISLKMRSSSLKRSPISSLQS